MSVREEAARFIEIGRRIERAETLSSIEALLTGARPETIMGELRKRRELADLHAMEAQAIAQQLIADLAPGAALGRRVLAAFNAARAAWRAAL